MHLGGAWDRAWCRGWLCGVLGYSSFRGGHPASVKLAGFGVGLGCSLDIVHESAFMVPEFTNLGCHRYLIGLDGSTHQAPATEDREVVAVGEWDRHRDSGRCGYLPSWSVPCVSGFQVFPTALTNEAPKVPSRASPTPIVLWKTLLPGLSVVPRSAVALS
jgi:hypothetical protein